MNEELEERAKQMANNMVGKTKEEIEQMILMDLEEVVNEQVKKMAKKLSEMK